MKTKSISTLHCWLAIIFFATFISCTKENACLNVINMTGAGIDSLEASIYRFGQVQKHGKLLPNGTAKFHFKNYSDSHYNIKIFLADGHIYEDSLGYITHNCNFNDTVQILKDSSSNVFFKYLYGK